MDGEAVDVVVVGAGLSGLVAARRLVAGGASVRVLEAAPRVGGRTLARVVSVDGREATFDVGGQWIGPGQDRVRALADELGLATFATHHDGDHVLDVGSRLRRYRGVIPPLPLRALLEIGLVTARTYARSYRVPLDLAAGAARGARYDAASVEHLAAPLRAPAARGAFDAAFRTVFGAEPRDLSLLWYLFYVRAGGGYFRLVEVEGGAQERRFVRGAHALATSIAAALGDRVTLGAPVRGVAQRGGGVLARFDGGEVRARRAVVALPPSLLARVAFDPAPPAAREELASRFVMGATVKVIAAYDRPFWRARGLSGQAVSSRGPVSVVFDNTSHDGAVAALVGFVVGDEARRWGDRDDDARRGAVLDQLAALFGEDARSPRAFLAHDWCAEPWTGGCPVASPPPGALAARAHALRAPHGLVHWAGTETATRNPGYLDGAVSSGERAAREVLAALGSARRAAPAS